MNSWNSSTERRTSPFLIVTPAYLIEGQKTKKPLTLVPLQLSLHPSHQNLSTFVCIHSNSSPSLSPLPIPVRLAPPSRKLVRVVSNLCTVECQVRSPCLPLQHRLMLPLLGFQSSLLPRFSSSSLQLLVSSFGSVSTPRSNGQCLRLSPDHCPALCTLTNPRSKPPPHQSSSGKIATLSV